MVVEFVGEGWLDVGNQSLDLVEFLVFLEWLGRMGGGAPDNANPPPVPIWQVSEINEGPNSAWQE